MNLLTDEELWALVPNADNLNDAKAVQAAILAKLASAELPEPALKLHGKHKNGKPSAESMTLYTADQLTAWGNTRFAQGAAAQLAEKPIGYVSLVQLKRLQDGIASHADLVNHSATFSPYSDRRPLTGVGLAHHYAELYTRRQAND